MMSVEVAVVGCWFDGAVGGFEGEFGGGDLVGLSGCHRKLGHGGSEADDVALYCRATIY